MKKLLLSVVACLAAVCASAEDFTWSKSITALSDAKYQAGTVVAVAPSDGSVYVTGTYDQDFTFGSTVASNPDEMASGYIAKYNADGEEQWVVTLYGNAAVTAATVDDDATLYVAGRMQDEVEITPAAGETKVLSSTAGVFSAFVLRVGADGTLAASKVITPKSGVPEGKGVEDWSDPCYITPRGIALSGDKVYVVAAYTGNVSGLGWKGSYAVMFGAYMDNPSSGIFSLDTNLASVANVATVQMTGVVGESQAYPRGMNLTAQDGVVYAGFFGSGQLTLTTPTDSKDFSFTVDEEENLEYAFVCIAFEGTSYKIYQYDAPVIANAYGNFEVAGMGVANGNLYVGGLYKGFLPFDNAKKSSDEDEPNHFTSDDMFAASIKLADMSVNWGWTAGWAAGNGTKAICMDVTNSGHLLLSSYGISSKYVVELDANGKATPLDVAAYDAVATSDAANVFLYKNGTSLDVSYSKIDPTGIESPKASTASDGTEAIYTINGVRVNKVDAPGVYVIKSADGVKKVVK